MARKFIKSALLFITLSVLIFQAQAYATSVTATASGNRGVVTVTVVASFDEDPNGENNGGSIWPENKIYVSPHKVYSFDGSSGTATYEIDTTVFDEGEAATVKFSALSSATGEWAEYELVIVPQNEPDITVECDGELRGVERLRIRYTMPTSYLSFGARLEFKFNGNKFHQWAVDYSEGEETEKSVSYIFDTRSLSNNVDGDYSLSVDVVAPMYRPRYDDLGEKTVAVKNAPEISVSPVVWTEDETDVTVTYDFPSTSSYYRNAYIRLFLNEDIIKTLGPIRLSNEENHDTEGSMGTTVSAINFPTGPGITNRVSADANIGSKNGTYKWQDVFIAEVGGGGEDPRLLDLIADFFKQVWQRLVTSVGEPINVANGNAYTVRNDISLSTGGMPLALSCTYNSQDDYDGPFGYGWHSSFDYEILEAEDGTVVEVNADGVVTVYTLNEDETYTSSAGKYTTLTKNMDDSFTVTHKHGTVYEYNSDGNLSTITDRNGNEQVFTYDAQGVLYEVVASNGQAIVLTANAQGKIETATDSNGNVYTYAYDESGDLLSVTSPDTSTLFYEYDENHNLTCKTDELGTKLYFEYDAEDRAIKNWQDGDTYRVDLDFSVEGQTTVTDSLGRETLYQFNEYGLVHTTVDPDGNIEYVVWDADMNKTSVTDKNGNVTTFTYDDSGNLTSITDPTGAVSTFEYEPAFNQVICATDPLGSTTEYEYDSYGNLTILRDALGNEPTYEYDTRGNVTASTDANGNRTEFTYDTSDNLITTTDALGNVTTFTYDANSNVTSITDALSNVTQFEYDALNRQTKIIYVDGAEVQFVYDAVGNKIQTIDALGNTTQFEYDQFSRIQAVVDALNNRTAYAYDTEGNQLSITDAKVQVTQYQYDNLNRLIKEIAALGNEKTTIYDAVGNKVSGVDAKGDEIQYTFDSRNLLTMTTYPDGATVSFMYDAAGRKTSMTDWAGTTSYTYDALGRLLIVDGPADADTIEYSYDAVGNRIQMIDQEGGVTTYEYDALNRLVMLTAPNLEETTYEYDAVSNLVKVSYPNNTTAEYTYDNRNRVTKLENKATVTQRCGRRGKTKTIEKIISSFEYSYDANGMRTQVVLDDGSVVAYEYDAINQLISEEKTKSRRGQSDTEYSNEYEYDALGNRLSMERTFEPAMFMNDYMPCMPRKMHEYFKHMNGKCDMKLFVHMFKKRGRIHRTRGWHWGHRDATIQTTYEYNEENQLVSASDALIHDENEYELKDTSFAYDANGNLIDETKIVFNRDFTTTYEYDYENRLISIVIPEKSGIQYTYDGTGKRISQTTTDHRSPTTVHYLYDGLNSILERNENGNLIASYVRGVGMGGGIGSIISKTTNKYGKSSKCHGKGFEKTVYYHYDATGNVMNLSAQRGCDIASYEYDSFGNVLSEKGLAGINDYQFSTKEKDSTGLVYYGARFYNPKLGRWITKDPMGYIDGPNPYLYVGNNPLNFIDPYGYFSIIVGTGGSVVAAAGAEGSTGIVITTDEPTEPSTINAFAAVGAGSGFSVGGDVFVGYMEGDLENFEGTTVNVNINIGPVSISIFQDPDTGDIIGATGGLGAGPVPFGVSVTKSETFVVSAKNDEC